MIESQEMIEANTFAEAAGVPSHADPQEDARRIIAVQVIFGYLIAIGFVLLTPLVLMLVSDKVDATSAKDLILALTAAVAGLNGVVGFIVGYYFKAADPVR